MVSAAKAPVGEVVLDHTSAAGPHVTHVRGTLLVNSLRMLEESGYLAAYLERMSAVERDAVRFTMAASWVPVELAIAHYEACDKLELSDAQMEHAGTVMGARIAETFLAGTLRATRPAGVDAVWLGIEQNHRLWDRLYVGGGSYIVKTGLKDVVAEMRGLPLVASRYFRIGSFAHTVALARLVCKNAFIKPARPRIPHPHTVAMAVSWV
jgi:hypothetical protein